MDTISSVVKFRFNGNLCSATVVRLATDNSVARFDDCTYGATVLNFHSNLWPEFIRALKAAATAKGAGYTHQIEWEDFSKISGLDVTKSFYTVSDALDLHLAKFKKDGIEVTVTEL